MSLAFKTLCAIALFFLASSQIGCKSAGPRTGAVVGSEPVPNGWWFPYNIGTGTTQSFHLELTGSVTTSEGVKDVSDQADFAVEISPQEDAHRGCIVRLIPGEERDDSISLATLWLQSWAATNPDGISVTRDELFVRDAPVLRGPWQLGDRMNLVGFVAILFFDTIIGFYHADVVSVTPSTVTLKFDFWAGKSGPAVRGGGQLSFAKDKDGITRVEAEWSRSDPTETRRTTLRVERTAIKRAGD